MDVRLQPHHVYFQKYGNTICLFVHNPNTNKTVHKSIKALCGHGIKTDCCFWDKDNHRFKEYSDKKGKCRIETAHTDNTRLESLQTAFNGILDSIPCYTPEDLYTAYKASLGIVCKAPTNKQTLLEYAVYYRDLWKSGDVVSYDTPSSNYRIYDKFINKLNGTKSGVVMPWAKQMKKFADIPIANISNDTFKNFCKLVASYSTKEHRDNKTDIAYKDTVKAFVAVVRRWHKEENDNPNFKFSYKAFTRETPKPQSKNNQQTFTDEQLKQFWEFDVTRIMPRVPKELKQLYLDTCLLMYKELSRPRDIIDMRIEDIITINGQLYWKYCPKKLSNHEFKNASKKNAPVEIHQDCIQIIQKYKGNRTKGYLLPFKINQKEETKNRDVDVNHVREKIRNFMCEIDKYYSWNIENLSMYNLRHTVITNAIISGMPIKLIAEYAKTSMSQIENTYSDTIKICRSASISNVI
ncbi:hypothetical protein [Prevotella sp.]|uniref:hypothetical protein n=1 Tax=Prevotella sp. TaxID=59823 RepID=UPI0027E23146|nr:hypothetical protein [Prevotella sp.]